MTQVRLNRPCVGGTIGQVIATGVSQLMWMHRKRDLRQLPSPLNEPTMPFYLTPKQDDFNQELQICIAEALYDVDSIVADPGAYTKEELVTLHNQIVSNLEQAWELTGGSEDQLLSTMMQISQVVAHQFNKQE